MINKTPPAPEAPSLPIPGRLVPAAIEDLSEVRDLIQEASDFKMSRGDDLWGEDPFTDQEVTRMIESGDMFVYKLNGVTAASVMLADADQRMWGEDEGGDGSATYVHKLCVGDDFRGQGVGRDVMKLAEAQALKTGKTKLRLDCPYNNRSLCEYYERLGFVEVRRYERPQSPGRRNPDQDAYKAALYQKERASS
jgi:ribosomal protein S18 acetylase RimI-like enzyme